MALQINMNTPSGIVVQDAYCRVENITVTKDRATFVLATYANQAMPHVMTQHFSMEYSLDGGNPIRQAYIYLKTLDQFADAEDV